MVKQYQELSKLFVETRGVMGITQSDFGFLLRVTQPNICSIESGKSDTKGTTVLKVQAMKVKALNIKKKLAKK